MSTTVAKVISDVAILLNDTDHDRWTEDELATYLSDGQVEIVINDATANVVRTPTLLDPGALQTTPDDCQELLDINMNLGREWAADTQYDEYQIVYHSTSFYRCTETHTSTSSFDTSKFTAVAYPSGVYIDEMAEANVAQVLGSGWLLVDPDQDTDIEPIVTVWVKKDGPEAARSYYVYPPQPETGRMYVQMEYSQSPAPITASDNITLPDRYKPALMDYMLFRAFSKNMDNPDAKDTAIQYWNKFTNSQMFSIRRKS